MTTAGTIPLPAQGATLITATRRLSRYLHYRHAETQLEAGHTVWETPDILAWNGWVHRLWEEHAVTRRLDLVVLGAAQQQAIWQQIVENSTWADWLIRATSAAAQGLGAWKLCQEWQLPVFPAGLHLNEDARAFRGWAEDYRMHCRSHGWIDEAGMTARLAEELTAESLGATGEIILLGFDEFTPLQRRLLERLSGLGCRARECPPENRNREVIAAGFADAEQEIRTTAAWARQKLESEPAGTVGIVVPDLRALHNRIENIFEDNLLPGALLSPSHALLRPYSIALGLPLIRYPVIEMAFSILKLGEPPVTMDDVGGVLRSPFIGGAGTEGACRAKLDACLREHGERELTVKTLLAIADRYLAAEDRPAVFLSACRRWTDARQALPASQSAAGWARDFFVLLKSFEWPGARTPDSAEYQALEAWQDLIGQFASLDLVSAPLDYASALAHLRQLATAFSFQPETPEVPVQIIGFTGAAGMQFDHLWVMGLHEETWPGKAEPNPFIPLALQRSAGLPDCSAENRLRYAESLTARLIASSPDVVLSYPQNEKERPLRISPLIRPYLAAGNNIPATPADDYARRLFESRRFEFLEDWRAPPVMGGQVVSGGAALFKDQSACPFRAFARHRLYAKGLEQADVGPDAMTRGSMVHRLMELLWQELRDYAALTARSESELETLVDGVVMKVINKYRRKFPRTYTRRFIQLERERLGRLLLEWLALERQRAPFTVTGREEVRKIPFQDMAIRTRIDRIDCLADGRHVIMDYKTGDSRLESWFGGRPEEPQLPLYATGSTGVAALAFAVIKRGQSAFIGLGDCKDLIPGVRHYTEVKQARDYAKWEDLLSAWQEVLARLAAGFLEGDARVDPRDDNACRVCDLHALCRIYERTE